MFYILFSNIDSYFNRVSSLKVLKSILSSIYIYNLLANIYLLTIKFN